MNKSALKDRLIEYVGNITNHSIVVGKYGNARIVASGNFDLKGLIFCPGSRVELLIQGNGTIKFNGTCRELIIQEIDGNCSVDLSELVSKMVRCEKVSAPSKLTLGQIRSLELNSVAPEATIIYSEQPTILNHTLLKVA